MLSEVREKFFSAFKNWVSSLFKKKPDNARARRGRLGERKAAEFLKRKGHKILLKNWRGGGGEWDIVTKDGQCLVFVEVRARDEKALVQGYHSLTKRKRAAFARACKAYLNLLKQRPVSHRADVVEVRFSLDDSAEIFHYENVKLLR